MSLQFAGKDVFPEAPPADVVAASEVVKAAWNRSTPPERESFFVTSAVTHLEWDQLNAQGNTELTRTIVFNVLHNAFDFPTARNIFHGKQEFSSDQLM